MKAARLNAFNEALSIEELPIPKPGPREVVVAVEACGVCGSDLSIIHGGLKTTLPRTLGHEIAGTVAEVGAGDGVQDHLEPSVGISGRAAGRLPAHRAHGPEHPAPGAALFDFAIPSGPF